MEIDQKFMEVRDIHGNLWKFMEIYEKFMEIDGHSWEFIEAYGNGWKFMETQRDLWEFKKI